MSNTCIACNFPVIEEDHELWLIGWSGNNCIWQHRDCPPFNESNESIPGSPIAESSRISADSNAVAPDEVGFQEILPDEPSSDFDDTPDEERLERFIAEEESGTGIGSHLEIDIDEIEDSISFGDETVREASFGSFQLIYEVVEDASKRGKRKLIDSLGYSYNIKYKGKKSTEWQCTKRPRINPCKTTVKETDGVFTRSVVEHNHQPETGALIAVKITTEVKSQAMKNLFKPASQIVDEVLLKELDNRPCPNLPKPSCIARAANKKRQKFRPEDPTNLDFELDEKSLPPEFLRGDVHVSDRRHLIFATKEQLSILSRAKNWYVDATFKLCRAPFKQLFTVNAFVRHEEYTKQVPLVYVLMSGRNKKDYKKIFSIYIFSKVKYLHLITLFCLMFQILQKITEILPAVPQVRKITLDFEAALWKALPLVFPHVTLIGCAFHWAQSVWRKIQELGLVAAFNQDQGTHKFLKQLLALPYLPEDEIPDVFRRLKTRASATSLVKLLEYIEDTWIESVMWPPSSWSVYGMAIRTNNDVEGWHNRLNRRASGKCQLPLYMLIQLLHEEAQLTKVYVRLISEKKLKRTQKKKYRSMQKQIFDLWEGYDKKERSAMQLLKACSHLTTRQV